MKTIKVDYVQVPNNSCKNCSFCKEKKTVVKGINAYGREFDSSVRWTRTCALFNTKLTNGYKKCQQCKDAEV